MGVDTELKVGSIFEIYETGMDTRNSKRVMQRQVLRVVGFSPIAWDSPVMPATPKFVVRLVEYETFYQEDDVERASAIFHDWNAFRYTPYVLEAVSGAKLRELLYSDVVPMMWNE